MRGREATGYRFYARYMRRTYCRNIGQYRRIERIGDETFHCRDAIRLTLNPRTSTVRYSSLYCIIYLLYYILLNNSIKDLKTYNRHGGEDVAYS